MKKLLKKNAPTQATYFKSESQRKKTSRLSFIYGSKRLVAVITILVLVSGVAGIAIVQKQRDSSAATAPWTVSSTTNGYTNAWSVVGSTGGAIGDLSSTPGKPLKLLYPVGAPKSEPKKTCFQYTIPSDIQVSAFNVTAVKTGTVATKVSTEFVRPDGRLLILAEDSNPGDGKQLHTAVDSGGVGGIARICHSINPGYTGTFSQPNETYVTGFAIHGTKFTADPIVPDVVIIGTVRDNSGAKNPIPNVTISNCQTTTTTDKNGQFSFKVKKGTGFCARTQEGLDPNKYLDVRATNTNKSGINANSVTYEQQIADGTQMTNYDFTARLKPAVATQTPTTPTTPANCASEAKSANTVERMDSNKFEIVSSLTPNPTQVTNETGADGCTAVVLFRNTQKAEYTFTTPNIKGKYNFLVRAASKVKGDAEATIVVSYPSTNPNLGDAATTPGTQNFGQSYSVAAAIKTGIPELPPNSKVKISISFKDGKTASGEDINLWVDYIEMRKADSAATVPAPVADTPGTGNAGNASGATALQKCSQTGDGKKDVVEAEKALCSDTVRVADDGSASESKAVLLRAKGEYVEYTFTAPKAGTYQAVARMRTQPDQGSQGNIYMEFKQLNKTASGANAASSTLAETNKMIAKGTGYTSYTPRESGAGVRTNNVLSHTLTAGQQAVIRVQLGNAYDVVVDQLLMNFVSDTPPVAVGSTPAPPKTVVATGSCTNDATGDTTVEAERAMCVPNVNKTVDDVDGIKAVQLRNDGDYVEFSFKNNKTPGKYRAESIVRKTESGSFVRYDLVKVIPNAIDITRSEGRNISTNYNLSFMTQEAQYINLTQEDINANIYLKVRVTYKNSPDKKSDALSRINVDKLTLKRTGNAVAPPTPAPATVSTPTPASGQTTAPTTSRSSQGAGTSSGGTTSRSGSSQTPETAETPEQKAIRQRNARNGLEETAAEKAARAREERAQRADNLRGEGANRIFISQPLTANLTSAPRAIARAPVIIVNNCVDSVVRIIPCSLTPVIVQLRR